MKYSLVFLLAVALSATACRQIEVSVLSPIDQIAVTADPARINALGRWRLMSIYNPWTGNTSVLNKNVTLTIDNQLRTVYYEADKPVARFRFNLNFSRGYRYVVSDASGQPTYFVQQEGNFRVSRTTLVFGDPGVDGPEYTFVRQFYLDGL